MAEEIPHASFRELIDAPAFIRCGSRRIVYRREDLDAWQQRHIQHVGPNLSATDASDAAL
jgi:hypothetical protein